MDLFNIYLLKNRFKTQKKFIVFGLLNFTLTQIILALLLLYFPIYISTLVSQFINLTIGYYVYSRFVFSLKNKFSAKSMSLFITYSIMIWLINWTLIYFNNFYFNVNKNISAIIILTLLIIS